jgi:hypothetical protein
MRRLGVAALKIYISGAIPEDKGMMIIYGAACRGRRVIGGSLDIGFVALLICEFLSLFPQKIQLSTS